MKKSEHWPKPPAYNNTEWWLDLSAYNNASPYILSECKTISEEIHRIYEDAISRNEFDARIRAQKEQLLNNVFVSNKKIII